MERNKFFIPKPEQCGEDWDAMVPVPDGRHCAACAHNLIDFSVLSDEQIVNVLKRIGGKKFCGRFAASQVDRVMIPPMRRRSLGMLRKIAAALLAVQAFANYTFAQKAKPNVYHSHRKVPDVPVKKIKGRLTDHSSKGGVAGATVLLMNGDSCLCTARTNSTGDFELSLPRGTAVTDWIVRGKVGEELAGSYVVPDVPFTTHELQKGTSIKLYGYPMHQLQHELTAEKVEVIVQKYERIERTFMGIPPLDIQYTVKQASPARNFWLGLIKPFRRKKR